jgi:hypothetical protein
MSWHTIYRRVGWRAMVKENFPMTSGYFEDIEVGDSRKAGPILSPRTK